jgi:hypothetical protein
MIKTRKTIPILSILSALSAALVFLFPLVFLQAGPASASDLQRERLIDYMGPERVNSMSVTARVGLDASVTFTESFNVLSKAEFIRGGISRTIPTRFRGADGKRRDAELSEVSAKIDFRKVPVQVTQYARDAEILVGDPKIFLTVAPHNIELTYKIVGPIEFGESFDELIWDVTGNNWEIPIEHLSFKIELPEGASVSRTAAFIGREMAFETGKDGVIRAKRAVKPGERFSVELGWNKGVVFPLPPARRKSRLLSDNFMYVAFLTMFIILYYFCAWYTVGRDPEPWTVIPLFTPPDGMEPGFARYIRDMRFTHDVIAADMMQLAVLGFIRFSEEYGHLVIKPTELTASGSERQKRLSESQLGLISILAPNMGRDGIAVSGGNGDIFIHAEDHLYGIYSERGKEYFSLNMGYSIAGFALFLPLVFIAPWTWPRAFGVLRYIIVRAGIRGAALSRLCLVLMPWFAITPFTAFFSRNKVFKWIGRAVYVISCLMLAVPVLVGLRSVFESDVVVFCLILAATAAATFFSRLMSVRTPEGARIMAEIDGLAMYMGTAERYRLAVLNPPEETPEVFEALLPYAYALNCSENWADHFAEVLRNALYKPDWDTTYDWGTSDSWRPSSSLSKDFARDVGQSIAAYKIAHPAERMKANRPAL